MSCALDPGRWASSVRKLTALGLKVQAARATVGITDAGWSSSVARRAHNPEVVSSNLAPATRKKPLTRRNIWSGAFVVPAGMNIEGPRIGPERSLEGTGRGAVLPRGGGRRTRGWPFVCGLGPLCAGLAGALVGLIPQCVSCVRGWPFVCGVGGVIGGVDPAWCFSYAGLASRMRPWRACGSVRFTQALERGIPTEASQTQPARGPSDHRA